MHVLYFHQHFSTPKGATGVRSYQMASKLVERGHKVTMVCGSYGVGNTGLEKPFSSGNRRGLVNGINVIEFDLAYSNNDSFVKRAVSFLKFAERSIGIALRMDYDILFATSTPLTASVPGIFAKFLRRKPFVFEVRDLWPELPREMGVITSKPILLAMDVLEWLSYRTANMCIALSPGIEDGIRKRSKNKPVKMIPNGCDLEGFSVKKSDAWRPEGIAPDDFVAVFTGTHGMANGLDAVLDCAAELKRRQRNKVKIVLIGHGKLKASLIERADQEGLDNVLFLDPVEKKQLARLLAGADVGLMTLANVEAFYYGTSPNKFFDYLAAGLPVINNYPGWLAEMIKENHCGIAIGPNDSNTFAEAIETLEASRVSNRQLGHAARKLGENYFDWNKLTDEMTESLETLVKSSNTRGTAQIT